MNTDLAVIVSVLLIGGLVSGSIAYSKHNTAGTFIGFFILGAVVPILGIIVAAISKGPVPPPQPPAWYPDPWNPAGLRYYDGAAWTWQTSQPTPTP